MVDSETVRWPSLGRRDRRSRPNRDGCRPRRTRRAGCLDNHRECRRRSSPESLMDKCRLRPGRSRHHCHSLCHSGCSPAHRCCWHTPGPCRDLDRGRPRQYKLTEGAEATVEVAAVEAAEGEVAAVAAQEAAIQWTVDRSGRSPVPRPRGSYQPDMSLRDRLPRPAYCPCTCPFFASCTADIASWRLRPAMRIPLVRWRWPLRPVLVRGRAARMSPPLMREREHRSVIRSS